MNFVNFAPLSLLFYSIFYNLKTLYDDYSFVYYIVKIYLGNMM